MPLIPSGFGLSHLAGPDPDPQPRPNRDSIKTPEFNRFCNLVLGKGKGQGLVQPDGIGSAGSKKPDGDDGAYARPHVGD
jgi:hypothetical protein